VRQARCKPPPRAPRRREPVSGRDSRDGAGRVGGDPRDPAAPAPCLARDAFHGTGLLGAPGMPLAQPRKETSRGCEANAQGLSQMGNSFGDCHAFITCPMPGRGRFITLLKEKNNLPKDEKRAGFKVTSFWPRLLDLESCSEEAGCSQPEMA